MTSKEKEQEAERLKAKQRQQLDEAENTPKQEDVADTRLAEIAKQGGALGKKLEREIRQFQQTGRVSSWLSGETLKSEAAQNAAQQSSFSNIPRLPPSRQGASIPLANANNTTKFGPKPEVADGGGRSVPHPFKIYRRAMDEVVEFKVELESKVYSGLGSFEITEITGLDSWTAAEVGYVIILGVLSGSSVTSQEILWGQESLGNRITFEEDTQTEYRVPIAYLYLDENDSLKIRQLAFIDKTIVTVCVNGKGGAYPIST